MMPKELHIEIKDANSQMENEFILIPSVEVPYNIFPKELYNAYTLYKGYDYNTPDTFTTCYDTQVYQHYIKKGKVTNDVKERLARTLHDHSISVALHAFIEKYPAKKLVGIMGGHAILRNAPIYRQVVEISKRLTEMGYLMISGGGPGAMEATHVGAWMAGRSDSEVEDALSMLVKYPSFKDEGWLSSAYEVIEKYPQNKYYSLGIPTWFYGHEPAAVFATHIAKYFDNSIREDGILSIATGGIIYTPGSSGTMQEIFQDAAQNHYKTFGFASPMTFLGVDYWTKEMPVYPLLEDLLKREKYQNLLLSITDSSDEIISEIEKFTKV